MSRRRARSSSAATCSTARWLSAQKRWCVVHSPCTRACRMNSSRETSGSIEPYCTRRPTTSGSPYSVTRSVATTEPRLASQRGSEYWRLTRCVGQLLHRLRVDPGDGAGEQPAGLDQLGGDDPARRLLRQRRAGGDRRSACCACRGTPGSAACRPFACSACIPTCESRPASSAAWMPRSSGSAAGSPRFMPSRRAVPRSWPCRSCHSRMRR